MARGSQHLGMQVHYDHGSGADEILRPTIMEVDGRRYRKITEVAFGPQRRKEEREENRGREKRPLFSDDIYDEGEDTVMEGVEPSARGGYVAKMAVPSVFFKYIIGKEGRTKSIIEKDTGCRLSIPGRGREGDVVVEGPTADSVSKAKKRLEVVVWTNRTKERPTHFISLPLNHPVLMVGLKDFKETVMKKCGQDHGVVPEVFQLPEKLHITVGVMRLFSVEEVERAKEILEECLPIALSQLGAEPVVISLRGVESMKDDPGAVNILYAKVHLTDGSDRLQQFVDCLFGEFMERAPDLMKKEFERERVKLHATVMNSKFLLSAERGTHQVRGQSSSDRFHSDRDRSMGRKQPFDARRIFKELHDFDFGQALLERVHLSKRGEYGPDGFYKCIAEFRVAQ